MNIRCDENASHFYLGACAHCADSIYSPGDLTCAYDVSEPSLEPPLQLDQPREIVTLHRGVCAQLFLKGRPGWRSLPLPQFLERLWDFCCTSPRPDAGMKKAA